MTGTLVLNASYEPLCVVAVRRAVVLVLRDKAVVEKTDEDLVLHSERLSVEAPIVVRLNRFVRVPRRTSSSVTRRGVLVRDRGRCAYCAGRAETIDHVVPKSRSGPHVWENVVAACVRCNHRKADRLLSELGWTLPFTPTQPNGALAGVARYDRLSDWEPYFVGWTKPAESLAVR